MVEIYLYLLMAICLSLLGWGLAKPERVYQYPFFMGGIFISFILPQAIALTNNPGPVSQQALERVLLMSCLCAAMCWLGYKVPPSKVLIKRFDTLINPKKLLQVGIAFIIIGYFFTFLIQRLPEEVISNTNWTGIVTIYAFFAGLIYPGFTIALLSALQRPSLTKFILVALAAYIPVQTIILYGRREPTATFILTIGLCLYFLRRYTPPRWLVLAALVLTLLLVPITGEYRSIAKTGNWMQLSELNPVEALQTMISQGKILEFRNAAILMDATVTTGQYGYGTGYWDQLIFRFIPGQFFGYDFKKSLQFSLTQHDLESLYNYSIPGGTTPTGVADSFIQFDYFGSLFFGVLAYFFKNLWISAIYRHSVSSQLFYVSLVSPAMISVTHGTVRITADLFFYFVFLGLAVVYSQQNSVIARYSHFKLYE